MALQSLKSNKKALRRAIATSLSGLPALAVETQCKHGIAEHLFQLVWLGLISSIARNITARVLSSSFFHECKTVSCYLSMPGEVDTSSIVSEILRAGKTLFVPKIEEGRMDLLKVYDEDDLLALPSGVWGIKEPSDEWKGQKRLRGPLFQILS